MTPVLLVTGPVGVGKSTVVHEADVLEHFLNLVAWKGSLRRPGVEPSASS